MIRIIQLATRGFARALFFVAMAMISLVSCTTSTVKEADDTIQLFNGQDFTGWSFYLATDTVDPSEVWSIRDGVIRCEGMPFGYMRTSTEYNNYTLSVEWRWPEEVSNSGIFLHIQEPDAIWPNNIEVQLWNTRAGDFVLLGGSSLNEKPDDSIVIQKMEDSSENPAGEWNLAEITCEGDSITVYINGVLQNKGTGASISSGFIGLQSEGKPIEFRNVTLKLLD